MAHDSGGEADGPVVILIPLFNDWASFTELVDRLDVVLGEHGLRAEVLIVDDGSTIEPSAEESCAGPSGAAAGRGAQAAAEPGPSAGDRHRPGLHRGARRLRRGGRHGWRRRGCPRGRPPAARTVRGEEGAGRSSSPSGPGGRSRSRFRVFYILYKLAARRADRRAGARGQLQRRPPAAAESLVVVSELWNHYAAAVFKSRQPFCTIPTRRARRLRRPFAR